MSEKPEGEKNFAPTEKRKRDAARKGDTLRSRELATAAAVTSGGLGLVALGPMLFDGLGALARASFDFNRANIEDFTPKQWLLESLEAVIGPLIALGLVVIIATVLSQMVLGEGRFVPANLAPKGSRINPLSGLKRIFGVHGLIELGKSLAKVALLGAIGVLWGRSRLDSLMAIGRNDLAAQLEFALESVVALFALLALGLVAIAAIDVPVQIARRFARLKMTHQEMREETKQTEGSPEMRGARRQRQRDLARGGLAKAMDEAQFVISNPSHFAVALAYDPALASAPVVLAKGRDARALAIRDMAFERGLPVLEYPQLARAVYFTTREHQVIREELYLAIARLVAFVFALRRGERPQKPSVDVPEELRFDAQGRPQANDRGDPRERPT